MIKAQSQSLGLFDYQCQLVANYIFKNAPKSHKYIKYINCEAFTREWEIVSQIEKFNFKTSEGIKEIS